MNTHSTQPEPPQSTWQALDEFRESLVLEQARAGIDDPTVVERHVAQVEAMWGLIGQINELPDPYRIIVAAIIAELNVHNVVFVNYHIDALRFRCAHMLATRCPGVVGLVSRGPDCVILRTTAPALPVVVGVPAREGGAR